MRCPDCSKFVSMETKVGDTEVDKDVDEEGQAVTLTGTVTVERDCADCGTTLKATTFDIDHEVDLGDLPKGLVDWSTVEAEAQDPTETESGGGRYAKNMVGFEMTVTVSGQFLEGKAPKGQDAGWSVDVNLADAAPASEYEEQV